MNVTPSLLPSESDTPWGELWKSGQTPWDQGGAHPQLKRLLEHARLEGGLKAGEAIYSGGVGRAHNEAMLAREGYQVRAVDFVAEAIEAAKTLYGRQERLELIAQDALAPLPDEEGRFAAIFDRAMLCALPPHDRSRYIAVSRARLKAGGLWMGILFREVPRREGPPFAIDERTAMALFSQDFDLCFAGACPSSLEKPGLEEWLCIWRRRDN